MDIVSYLCKFETKWHDILDTLTKVLAGKSFLILFQPQVNRHSCDAINFMKNVILCNLLVM